MAESQAMAPMETGSGSERPAKRARVFGLDGASDEMDIINESEKKANAENEQEQDSQHAKERNAGIVAFVNPDSPGFTGLLKKRYTDFLVNEILPDGTVLHLQNLQAPKPKKPPIWHGNGSTFDAQPAASNDSVSSYVTDVLDSQVNGGSKDVDSSIAAAEEPPHAAPQTDENAQPHSETKLSTEDTNTLVELFDEEGLTSIVKLYEEALKHPHHRSGEFIPFTTKPVADRQARTSAHQTVRRVFHGKLETQTNDDNTIKFTVTPPKSSQRNYSHIKQNQNRLRGKPGWDELGGEYLHFSLYKENKDTMESVFFLATQSRVNVKLFQFGGTKDRRAVTVQRISVRRMHAEQLAGIGRKLRNAAIGDYEYRPKGLELGELGGNEFCISLRDCHFPGEERLSIEDRVKLAQSALSNSISAFESCGFLNYYGLQRFGSYSTSTATIGMKMLQGDLKGAVEGILHFSQAALDAALEDKTTTQISNDDKARAMSIDIWNKTGNSYKANDKLPRKFSAENNIIRYLGSYGQDRTNDFQGALMTISRQLRLMYVHAYQSLVWNQVASKRWGRHGARVIEGDLVVIDPNEATATEDRNDVDESGEPIVRPEGEDAAGDPDQGYTRARPLSAEEAASGKYSIFDIVLPLPGYDVVYPSNEIEGVYKDFMASESGGGLDPYDMRRPWKDISLSGGYRKFLARPEGHVTFEIKTYMNEDEQLVETDLQRIEKKKRENRGEQPVVIAKEDSEESVKRPEKPKIAVIVRMKLGPSTYATMALRELMGSGGVKTYKPDFGSGRT